MYPPYRKDPSKMFLVDWAAAWMEEESGFLVKIHELAAFDPIRTQDIRKTCSLSEIAAAWKSKVALSEYAWSD